jgi:hypothetical protein
LDKKAGEEYPKEEKTHENVYIDTPSPGRKIRIARERIGIIHAKV